MKMVRKFVIVLFTFSISWPTGAFAVTADRVLDSNGASGVSSLSVPQPEKVGFWKSKSRAKLGWGWALLIGGTGAAVYGLSTEETMETKTEVGTVTSSCGPGCTATQTGRVTKTVPKSETRSPAAGVVGIGTAITGLSFLVSYAMASKGGAAKPQTVTNSSNTQGNRSGFWRRRSAKKLWWGIGLALLGGGATVYGLGKETKSKTVIRTVTIQPTSVVIGNASSSTSYSYGTYSTTVDQDLSGTATNSGNEKLKNIVIETRYTDVGGYLDSDTDTIASLDAGQSAVWYTNGFFTTYYSSFNRSTKAISAQVDRAATEQTTKARSQVMGYAGAGVTAVGLSFLLSYAANSVLPMQKADNLDINPVMFAQRGSSYQGVQMSYRF